MSRKPAMASAAIPLNIMHSQQSHNLGISGEIVGNSNSQEHHTTMDEQSHLIYDLNDARRPKQPPISMRRQSLFRTNVGEISLSTALFLLPVALSAVLMYLIYANLESTQSTDSITENNNQTRNLSNQEYYVDYSATRLVFISSLSSTLALALVPVGMGLFGYMTGRSMQKASASEDLSRLPSPYQFELTLRLLGGSLTDLYRYVLYIFRGKRKRVPTVRMLQHAALILIALLMLAILVTVVDAFLHVATSTVQFNRNTSQMDASYNPGRRLPDSCLDGQSSTSDFACNIIPGGSGAKWTFQNATEAYRIMGNASVNDYIRLADDGLTSVVVPVTSPSGVSYTAQSFGSSTTCKTVTKLCKPHYDDGGCDACQQWFYNCTVTEAGLQMSGTFNGDTSSQSIVQTFYTDSSKAHNITGNVLTPDNGQFWTSLLFELDQAELDQTTTIDNGSIAYDANRDLISSTYGIVYGIFSCNTTLSLVTYTSDVNQNIHNITTTPMNDTAGAPFIQALGQKFGDPTLENGLGIAEASSQDSVDLAYRYARLLDRTTLGLTAGILDPVQPDSSTLLSSKQVAKVPIPEFVALITLNLILSAFGIYLGLQALFLSRKQGVTDVQARLGLGAMVAGVFEDEKLNESARSVEDLYAELRGMDTVKIMAVDPGARGGKIFVGVPGDRIGKMDEPAGIW